MSAGGLREGDPGGSAGGCEVLFAAVPEAARDGAGEACGGGESAAAGADDFQVAGEGLISPYRAYTGAYMDGGTITAHAYRDRATSIRARSEFLVFHGAGVQAQYEHETADLLDAAAGLASRVTELEALAAHDAQVLNELLQQQQARAEQAEAHLAVATQENVRVARNIEDLETAIRRAEAILKGEE